MIIQRWMGAASKKRCSPWLKHGSFGGFHKWWYSKMDGLEWKIMENPWMI